LQAHRDFLEKYYSKKVFLASGPKKPRNGGVILAAGDLSVIEALIKEDPFYQQDIAAYRLIEFEPNQYAGDFKMMLGIPKNGV
jgi:uncharacterized protein YciI